MDVERLGEEVRRLGEAIARIEERLAALEAAPRQPVASRPHAPPPTASAEVRPPHAYSLYFTLLATVCFVLVGALVLRVAAQQGWLAPSAGTAIGLAYCAALLTVPLLFARRPGAAATGTAVQLCGAVLAPLVVLEMVHRAAVMAPGAATAVLAAAGFGAAALGAATRRPPLTAVGLLVAVLGVAAIGPRADAAVARALVALAAAGAALLVARWRGWTFLCPLVCIAAAVVLTGAVAFTAHRATVPAGVGDVVVVIALGLWALVALRVALRGAALGPEGAFGFALTTFWASGLLTIARPDAALVAGPAAAAVLLATGVVVAWRRPAARSLARAFTASGLAAAVLALPRLDPTGVSLAAAAVATWAAGRLLSGRILPVLSLLPAVAALATALVTGGLWTVPAPSLAARCAAGLPLAALLWLHARALGGPALTGRGEALWRWLAPIPLVAGVVVLFATLRACAFSAVGEGGPFQLAQTVILAAFSVLCLTLARVWQSPPLRVLGLVCVAGLAARVLLLDLFSLSGELLLGAVVSLGLVSVATSFLIRRPAGAAPPAAAPAAEPGATAAGAEKAAAAETPPLRPTS